MYIKEFRIKNFRNFDDAGVILKFHQGVNAIVGENNAGKSAIISALRIAVSIIQYKKDIYFTKTDFHLDAKGVLAKEAQFDIYLANVPKYLIEIWKPNTDDGEFHIKFFLTKNEAGKERIKYSIWGGEAEGNQLSADTLEAINLVYLGALRDAENEMRPNRNSKIANLLGALAATPELKEDLVNELVKANNALLQKEPISKIREIINRNLVSIEHEVLHQQIDIGFIDPKFDSIASSLRTWILPRWSFVDKTSKYFSQIKERCSTHKDIVDEDAEGIFLDVKKYSEIYEEIDEEESNLPYNDNIFKLISGNPQESVYWENKSPYLDIDCNFEYTYDKFIEFAPYQLIDVLAYHITLDYDHEIKLLKAIIRVFENKEIMPKIQSKIYALNKLVSKMDSKYYSDELAKCEFELLPLLLSDLGDYPIGIKKYFWKHPEFLGQLLISLHNQKGQLVKDSIGQKILYEAYCSFSSGCYIPVDYLLQKRDELKSWANIVLEQSKSSDEIVRRLVKSAIINTLACCPKNIAQDVWPIREIADILEDLSRADYDDPYRVSSNFYCAYANRRGVRTVEDGSAEFALSAEFTKYKESYEFSHPITSKALEYIANGYESEGEMDRTWAYLGR